MSDQLFFSSGAAARQLNTSPDTIRRLVTAGSIPSVASPGGHVRISSQTVEELKRTGLPSLPKPLPGDNPSSGPAKARYGRPDLLAPPSDLAVNAVESVSIAEAALKRRRLEWELLQVEDQFTEREAEEENRLAAQEQAELDRQAAERRRQAREEAERERESWLASWEAYSLNSLPSDAPAEVRLTVHEAVRQRLQRLQPIPETDVTHKLADALVAKALAPWRRTKEIEKAVQSAVDNLPSAAKSYWEPTEWQLRATQAARQAARQLPAEATMAEVEAVTRRAVEPITSEFEALQARRADAEFREHLVRWVTLPAGLPEQDKETAIQAVRQALAALPLGTPRPALDRAVEEALEPFRVAVAQLQAQARAEQQRNQAQVEAERQRIQERATRQDLCRLGPWVLPWDFPAEKKPLATAAVARALDALPEGTPQRQLEQARTAALAPFIAAHAQRQRKETLIRAALRELPSCLRKLERDWDFEGATVESLAQQFHGPIRERLESELTADSPPDQVARLVRRLVEGQLRAAPEPAATR